MINAAAFPFTTAHASFRLHEVAEWFTSNLNPGVINCPLVVNKQALASLPDEYRTMLYDLKPGMYEAMRQAYAEGDAEWLPIFRRSEEHTSELQSLMRISYAVFCLKKKKASFTRTNN